MEYISVKAASDKFKVTPRWIQKLCEGGKVEGAVKLEGSGIWLIPKDAEIFLERNARARAKRGNDKGSASKKYVPKPLDTGHIELPEDLRELTEKIAENVHEVWAACRIAEGWTYGEKRNDLLKQTPCLVPYSELKESEKEYDRRTAVNTLKYLIAHGYRIEKDR